MRIILWSVVFFAVIVAATFLPWIATVGIFATILFLWFLTQYLAVATIILIFLYPFLGLVVDFSAFELFRPIPIVGTITAPLPDILAIFIFSAWLILTLGRLWRSLTEPGKLRTFLKDVRLPAFFPMAAFFASGALSLINVPLLWFKGSVKYLFRPIGFFYAVYVIPIVNVLRSERMIRAALWAMWLAGGVASLFGIASFFVTPATGFPRATVFSIGSFAPFGTNHNLLAETLVATAPLGLALCAWYTRKELQRWIIAGSVVQIAIALLTFARTAWIALVVQAFILAVTLGKIRVKTLARKLKPALLLFIPLAVIMTTVSLSEVVQSSTMTRADMARIAMFYWARSPVIGQGVGTYIGSLWTVRAFTRDYGDPLDAHGVVWKLLFEQGTLGVITFGVLIAVCLYAAWRAWRTVYWSSGKTIMSAVLMMMSGAVVYQLFNTMYYTSKLWVPMGVGLAASYLYGSSKHRS